MNLKKIKNWGFADLAKAIWVHINEGKCVNCQKEFFLGFYDDWQRVVGFTKAIKPRKESTVEVDLNIKILRINNPVIIGTFIVKCAHCQKLYWFHARESHIKVMQRFELWPQIWNAPMGIFICQNCPCLLKWIISNIQFLISDIYVITVY